MRMRVTWWFSAPIARSAPRFLRGAHTVREIHVDDTVVLVRLSWTGIGLQANMVWFSASLHMLVITVSSYVSQILRWECVAFEHLRS